MKKIILLLVTAIAFNSIIAQTTAINETFETWPAAGWNNYQYEEGGWVHSTLFGADLGHNGGNCAAHKIENDAVDDWLVSPQVDIISSDYELSFFEKSEDLQYYTSAWVYISMGSGDPADGDFVPMEESLLIGDAWVEHIVNLSPIAGQSIYIAFVFQGASSNWHKWWIDDVVVASTSLIDAALTEVVNPTGINPVPSTEDVIVTLHNYGTANIDNVDIEWFVNDLQQSTYQATNLNLAPGSETNITVGNYNFAIQGDYDIALNVLLSGDSNPSNDSIEITYYVTDPKDAALTDIAPEGYLMAAGMQDVVVTVSNEGNYIINSVEVEWEVNGEPQSAYTANSIDLNPGESMDFNIGQFDFVEGPSEIIATVNISGDENLSNNTNNSWVTVNVLWESFEGGHGIPEMWSANDYPLVESFFPAPFGELYYSAQVDNNFFGEVSDTLYTPLLNIENGDEINFWVGNSFFSNNYQLIWKDGTTGQVNLIGDITYQPAQWSSVTMDISSAAGINYIGFVNANTGTFGMISLDMITSTAPIYHFDYDLGVKGFDFEELARLDVPHTFNVSIRNYGLNQVDGASYTVKLMTDNGGQLAEQSGVDLQPWQETVIEIEYTFTELQNLKVYAIINYSSDQQLANDSSVVYPVSSVPADIETTDVGYAEVENLMIPFDTGGDSWTLDNADISQQIYYQDELTSGYLYGVTLYYHELFAVGQYLPLQVWLQETDLNDLTGGWIPAEEMQMVFNDTIDVYPGYNSVYIPFDEPFLVTGESNLAIQYFQDEPEWPYTACRFYSTNANGPVRGIRLNNVYDLDPYNPPDFWGEHTDYTYTSFAFLPFGEQGIISGIVYDENNDPVNLAKVEIEDLNIDVYTNENGEYVLPGLPYNTYEINASYFGYYNLLQTIVLDEPTETLDFYLESLPLISVFGEVYGSNAPTVPLENVQVEISGYNAYTTFTNTSGEFMVEDVYANNEYVVTFQLYGYHDYIVPIALEDIDLDMGNIILNEEFISAYNVMVSGGINQVFVEWEAPSTSQKTKLQNDADTISNSYTNEPFEDVWLGNLFENENQITLRSVEIYWDIYELTHDFVTIDILDNEGNVLVSSEQFLTFNDTLMTIDIPNIFIEDDFYAMVHWQNNPDNTDALAIDFSDNVPNTACIMYPGETPQLLSDFIGTQNGSWFVRVNILEDGSVKGTEETLSYNIYKGLASDIANAGEWTVINTEPVTELTYTDDDWTGGNGQIYSYAVEAIYTEGEAEYSFSNFIQITIGMEESNIGNEKVTMYPNPAVSYVNIAGIEAGKKIRIYDMAGKIVHIENSVLPLTQINVSKLTMGVYYIRIDSLQGEIVKKLIINK